MPTQHQNKLGLDEVPTLSYGGSDGGGDSGGGGGGDAPAAAKKTIFKVKVTGFGDKAKIKVCGGLPAAYNALPTLLLLVRDASRLLLTKLWRRRRWK